MYYLKKLGYSRWGGVWMILGISNRTKFSPGTPKKENLFCLDLFLFVAFWKNNLMAEYHTFIRNRSF